jgi:hypothetical protein
MLALGHAMNAVRDGVFTGLLPRGGGFTCDVCEDPSWAVQEQAISSFVTEFGEGIRRARAAGMCVTVDVLIETEDMKSVGVKVVAFDPDLLLALGSAGVHLELSSIPPFDG